jgi:hypothetical protein
MRKEYLPIPMPRRLRRGCLRQESSSKPHTKRLYTGQALLIIFHCRLLPLQAAVSKGRVLLHNPLLGESNEPGGVTTTADS